MDLKKIFLPTANSGSDSDLFSAIQEKRYENFDSSGIISENGKPQFNRFQIMALTAMIGVVAILLIVTIMIFKKNQSTVSLPTSNDSINKFSNRSLSNVMGLDSNGVVENKNQIKFKK